MPSAAGVGGTSTVTLSGVVVVVVVVSTVVVDVVEVLDVVGRVGSTPVSVGPLVLGGTAVVSGEVLGGDVLDELDGLVLDELGGASVVVVVVDDSTGVVGGSVGGTVGGLVGGVDGTDGLVVAVAGLKAAKLWPLAWLFARSDDTSGLTSGAGDAATAGIDTRLVTPRVAAMAAWRFRL